MASHPAVIAAAAPIPPRWAKLCLCLIASTAEREDRCGDLEEEFHTTFLSQGPEEAARNYVANVMDCIAAILQRRVRTLISPEPDDLAKFQIVVIAAMVAVGLVYGVAREATAEVWWVLIGYGKNPGYYYGVNHIDYPVCAPWRDESGTDRLTQDLASAGRHVSRRETRIVTSRGAMANLSMLLPRDATIVKIYCGMPHGAQPVTECSTDQCVPGVNTFLEDSNYTNGRALTLRFIDPMSVTGEPVVGTAWVVWKD